MNNKIGIDNKNLKLIALDLDGTTLNSSGILTERTRTTIERAIEKGFKVVIATGRVRNTLPEAITKIKGLKYAITSNGASVYELPHSKPMYTNFIPEKTVGRLLDVLRQYNYIIEVFTQGRAYLERSAYEGIREKGSPFGNAEYLLSTREHIEDLFELCQLHCDSIENINIYIQDGPDRERMRAILEGTDNIEVTSSYDYNLEICGRSANKAASLEQLCNYFGVRPHEIIACGDGDNDIKMLKFVGVPVAMENANEAVKAVAQYITLSNDENGVGELIDRII